MARIKRIVSILLVWCTLLGLLPNLTFAVNGTSSFEDVQESDWFYDDVHYVYTHDLMNGTSTTTFAPQTTTTRAMIVTILHRLEGRPSASNAGFSDVSAGQFFTEAVNWAAEQSIVHGYGNGMFGPNDDITREQMAAILYRYATYKNYDVTKKADCSKFSDTDQISDYAVEALAWCHGEGLVNGTGNHVLAPKGSATRAQAAAILTRFCKNIVSPETPSETPAEPETYTVTFYLNYGKNETYQSEKVTQDEKVKKPSDPTRKGYTFQGWYTKKSNGTRFDFESPITENLTLYAVWRSANSGGGGTSSSSSSGGNSHHGSSDDSVTRQTWILELMQTVGLFDEDTMADLSESSFSDVSKNPEDKNYLIAIEMALRNHVIEQGTEEPSFFYPTNSTTELFAVETAVRALGFSYESEDECFQIAKDVALFDSRPSSSTLTLAQKNRILDTAANLVKPVVADPTPQGEVIVPETTKQIASENIKDCTIASDTLRGTLTLSAADEYKEGSCIILPASEEYPGGLPQKIQSISQNPDGTVTVTTEQPTLDEVMGNGGKIDISGVVSTSGGTFIPSEEILEEFDVELNGVNYSSNTAMAFRARKSPFRITTNATGITFSAEPSEDHKAGLYGEATIFWPSITYKDDIEWFANLPTKVNEIYFSINETVQLEGGLEWIHEGTLGSSKKQSLKLGTLAKIPIPGTAILFADVDLYLKWEVTGKVGFTLALNGDFGVHYKDGHMRTIKRLNSLNMDYKAWEVAGKAGPEIAATLDIWELTLADVAVSAGLGAKASGTFRDTSNLCIDANAYLYGELSAFRFSALTTKLHLLHSLTTEFWNENTSPLKWNWHFEGTQDTVGRVPKCTFGYGTVTAFVKNARTNEPISSGSAKAVQTSGDGQIPPVQGVIHNDGELEFTNLTRGHYKITVSADGYETYEKQDVIVTADETTDLGTIHLEPKSQYVSGTVCHSITEKGIPNAAVTLHLNGSSEENDVRATTDSDGHFEFARLPWGTYTVTVVADGYETYTQDNVSIQSGQDTDLGKILLIAKVGTVTGFVYDSVTGSIISNATVTLRLSDPDAESGSVNVGTSEDGKFQFEDVPLGTYTIYVSAENYESYEQSDVIVKADEITSLGVIRLLSEAEAGSGAIHGSVYDSSTDRGISGAQVTLYIGNGTDRPAGHSTITNADGQYEFADIPSGNYTIVVSKNQYADGFRAVTVTPDGANDQNVTLIPLSIAGGSSGFQFYPQLSSKAKTVYNAVISSSNRDKLRKGEKITVWESNPFTFREIEVDADGNPDYTNWNVDYETWWNDYVFTGAWDYIDAIDEAYTVLYWDHPELFWTGCIEYFWGVDVREGNGWCPEDLNNSSYEAGKTYRSNAWVQFKLLEPWSNGRSVSSDESTVASRVSSIVSQIDRTGSRYQQLLQVHDWLTMNNHYNTAATDNIPWSPLSALSTSYSPVCAGYAEAFQMLCDKLNIPCISVGGTGVSGGVAEAHMWNYVQMEDGKWYAVDVTWDDPLVAGSSNHSGFEHHEYFLVGSSTVIDGVPFSSSHQPDTVNRPSGGSFVRPSLSAEAYGIITIRPAAGGTVEASPVRGGTSAAITLTIHPNSGYELSSLVVKDNQGNTISLLPESDTQFRFIMPSGHVTVTPAFREKVEETPEPEAQEIMIHDFLNDAA